MMTLPFTKKAKSKSKRKSGRRPKWNNDDVDDMVDIIVNSDYDKRRTDIYQHQQSTKW